MNENLVRKQSKETVSLVSFQFSGQFSDFSTLILSPDSASKDSFVETLKEH